MDAALGRFTTVDPMAEKYYNISPYAYCANNPVKYVDPTGMIVIALDEESRRNIINTLTEQEAKYVRFKKDGTLDTKYLNKSKSESDNMTALKTLAGSDLNYKLMVADKDWENKPFTGERSEGNYYYGVTNVPNGEQSASPDEDVYILTSSLLSEGKQAENVAHEAYGHAYLYEKSRTDKSIDPWHRYDNEGIMVWDETLNCHCIDIISSKTNTNLENRIKTVTDQARVNYNNRKKKK